MHSFLARGEMGKRKHECKKKIDACKVLRGQQTTCGALSILSFHQRCDRARYGPEERRKVPMRGGGRGEGGRVFAGNNLHNSWVVRKIAGRPLGRGDSPLPLSSARVEEGEGKSFPLHLSEKKIMRWREGEQKGFGWLVGREREVMQQKKPSLWS